VTSEKRLVSENSGRVKKITVRSDVTTVDAGRLPFSAHSRTDVAISLMNFNAKFAVSFVFGTFLEIIHFTSFWRRLSAHQQLQPVQPTKTMKTHFAYFIFITFNSDYKDGR
jgi:hypothetical protein